MCSHSVRTRGTKYGIHTINITRIQIHGLIRNQSFNCVLIMRIPKVCWKKKRLLWLSTYPLYWNSLKQTYIRTGNECCRNRKCFEQQILWMFAHSNIQDEFFPFNECNTLVFFLPHVKIPSTSFSKIVREKVPLSVCRCNFCCVNKNFIKNI